MTDSDRMKNLSTNDMMPRTDLIDEVAENLNSFVVDIFEVQNSHVGFEKVADGHKFYAVFIDRCILIAQRAIVNVIKGKINRDTGEEEKREERERQTKRDKEKDQERNKERARDKEKKTEEKGGKQIDRQTGKENGKESDRERKEKRSKYCCWDTLPQLPKKH